MTDATSGGAFHSRSNLYFTHCRQQRSHYTMSGFVFEKHAKYCAVHFTPDLEEMPWNDVESATTSVSELVHEAGKHAVLIDLSQLQKVPTGLLPLMVRVWKAMDSRNRRFVVFASLQLIRDELKQAGLDGLWTVASSAEESFKALGVSGASRQGVDQTIRDVEDEIAESNSANSPMILLEQRKFNSVQFFPIAMSMNWMDVEAATTEVIRGLRESEKLSVMVDLSHMDMINSGLIASLVRIWKAMKERNGQFSIVCPNDRVTEILKTAGLWKLWSVVDDREEAVYELGVSRAAIDEKRERRFLMLVAAPCSVIAALALIPMFLKRSDVMGVDVVKTAELFAACAVVTGLISIWKDSGMRRWVSCGAVAVALGVLVFVFKSDVSFGWHWGQTPASSNTDVKPAVPSGQAVEDPDSAGTPGTDSTDKEK